MINPLTGNWWANLDFETRSCLDLPQVGAHLYAAHPSTEVICLRYSICGGEKIHEWFPGWPLPADLEMGILQAGRMEAWNAAFERLIWHHIMAKRHNAPAVDMEQWVCTMVRAYLQGFPGKLDAAGPSMGLGITKDAKGHSVMMQVAKPRRRKGGVLWTESDPGFTEVRAQAHPPGTFVGGLPAEFTYFMHDGQETVAQWWVDHDRIKTVVDYCAQDVMVESAASVFLDPMPPKEHKGWCLDQRINDRGFYIDLDFVGKARAAIRPATDAANHELIRLTNGRLRSVTQPNEIRAWINAELGLELDSIDKDTLNILLVEHENMPDVVREVIELRMAAAKTSTAKMNAMVRGTGSDWIFRGGLQYAGAGRTNRWAGRRLQPHNFPRPPKWATQAIPYIQAGRIDHVALLFGTPLEAISAVLRSCITARPGYELHVADYNAIEARIVAWYAQAARILNAFRTGDDPYRIQAASVYGVQDWRDIPKDSDERMLGKKIILGAGFGMGKDRFWSSCREDGLFISKHMAKQAVDAYRTDNPEIPRAWYELDQAAISAFKAGGQGISCLEGKVTFWRDTNFLRCRLASGRVLSYLYPRIRQRETPWGAMRDALEFWGWNGQKNRMEWQTMYGGRWMENVVQATARDVMLDSMLRLDGLGWNIILTVHDEELTEAPIGAKRLPDMVDAMETPPHWAPDLPLKVEGWTGFRYRK